MRIRGTPVALIVNAYIALRKRGRDVPLDLVEATLLAHQSTIAGEEELVRRVEDELVSRKGVDEAP